MTERAAGGCGTGLAIGLWCRTMLRHIERAGSALLATVARQPEQVPALRCSQARPSPGCASGSGPALSETGSGSGPSWEEFRANPPVTWERFLAGTAREPFPPHRFIVAGDIVLSDE